MNAPAAPGHAALGMRRKKHAPAGRVRHAVCMETSQQGKVKLKGMAAVASQAAAQEYADKSREVQF